MHKNNNKTLTTSVMTDIRQPLFHLGRVYVRFISSTLVLIADLHSTTFEYDFCSFEDVPAYTVIPVQHKVNYMPLAETTNQSKSSLNQEQNSIVTLTLHSSGAAKGSKWSKVQCPTRHSIIGNSADDIFTHLMTQPAVSRH